MGILSSSDWIKMGLAATPGFLALGWNIWKHFSDRAEKRREAAEVRKEKLVVRKIWYSDNVHASSFAAIRLANEGTREVLLESAMLCWTTCTDGVDDLSSANGKTITIPLNYTGVRLTPASSLADPIAPGHTCDFRVYYSAIMAQLTPILDSCDIWVDVESKNGHVLRIPRKEIDWAVSSLLQNRK